MHVFTKDFCRFVCMYTHIGVLVFVCAMMYIIIRGKVAEKLYDSSKFISHSGCSNFVSAKNNHLALYLETYLSPCFSLYRVIFISILQVTFCPLLNKQIDSFSRLIKKFSPLFFLSTGI